MVENSMKRRLLDVTLLLRAKVSRGPTGVRGDGAEASRRVASLPVVLLVRTTQMTLASLRSLSTSSSTLSTYVATAIRGASGARGD